MNECPRVIFETDLHCDCGLVAAAAWTFLTRHGVKAKVLNIRYGPSEGHTVTVFETAGGVICTYDYDGCLVFNGATGWKTPPLVIAKVWERDKGGKRKVVGAKWLGES